MIITRDLLTTPLEIDVVKKGGVKRVLKECDKDSIDPSESDLKRRTERDKNRWAAIREKIHNLFTGCNRRERCSSMRAIYWRESIPVRIGEMVFHQYPGTTLDKKWLLKSDEKNYENFIKKKMLNQTFNLAEINVIYFNTDEIKQFQATFQSGLICKRGEKFKKGRYIYVYNRAGDFLIAHKYTTAMGRIQHSSLAEGRPVKSAGWLTFDQEGRLTEIANFSGHYLICRDQVNEVLAYLEEKGISLSEMRILFSPEGKADAYNSYNLDEWKKIE